MRLEEVEKEIQAVYRWFAEQAPGVRVQEHGRLAQLWAEFDSQVGEDEDHAVAF